MDSFVEARSFAVPGVGIDIGAGAGASGSWSLAYLFRLVAATAMAGALSACGGGGVGSGDAPVPPPPAPTPSPTPAPPQPIPAQLSVPTPTGYDADRLAAFNRLNEIRLSAGLGMLAQSTQMDQAAQAHAEWVIANNSFTHDEQAGTPGFTGTSWPERDEAFGYVPVEGYEVMAAPVHGAAGVDGLVNTVYHRAAILAFEPVDVGVGWSALATTNVSMPLVIDMTKPGEDPVRAMGQLAQASINGVAIWPLAGTQGVPIRLGLESPNPVPEQDVLTLGTPASISVEEEKTITATSFVMTNSATGIVVPTRILTVQNDPNLFIPKSFIAAVPLAVLEPNTTYAVTFAGSTVQFFSGAVEAINRQWSFTTAGQ